MPLGRASASELEQHLPYVPLAAALREAVPGRRRRRSVRRPPCTASSPSSRSTDRRPAPSEVEALESLVELVAEHAPLVLLIDDLHWADPATVAAVSYLHRRCAGVPLALVATVGSEHAPPEHPVRRLRPDDALRLEPLTAAELAPLGVPDLHASTGGNPRFVAAGVAEDADHGLGDALAETLLAQCRAEGAWGYRVLLAASVLDQPFDPEPLASVLDAELDRARRGARPSVRAPHPARRRAALPLPLQPRARRARREPLAGPPAAAPRAARHPRLSLSRTTIRAVGSQGG